MNQGITCALGLLCAVLSCQKATPGLSFSPTLDAGSRDSAADAHSEATTARCRNRVCFVPAGTFVMGSPPDEPGRGRYTEKQREVTLTHALLVDQYELTQAEWTGYGYPNQAGTRTVEGGGRDCTDPSCPAANMTWMDAVSFANDRSRREGRNECIELLECTGRVGVDLVCASYRQTTPSYYDCDGYRLPTLAEFQYAARAGTSTAFYSGPFEPAEDTCVSISHLMAAAWYCANSDNRTHPTGERAPNAWGLYDILGNAAEFTASHSDGDTTNIGSQIDPQSQLDPQEQRVFAGGFYFADPASLRCASQSGRFEARGPERLINSGVGLGFRLVRSLSVTEAAIWR